MRVLQTGHTCWRIEPADRVALIVDAADYFRAARSAMLKAQHSIFMIGWDFDTRIDLDPTDRTDAHPTRLGAFLTWLVEAKPDLQINILKWDLGMVKALWRGTTVFRLAQWAMHERISFKLDGSHPPGAAQHHKIVVIDDAVAFCGGIDMTADRWDTPEHRDNDPRRRRPFTRRAYGPWHDATTAVSGAAAKALGDHARERWKRATGQVLAPPPISSDPWPEHLPVDIPNVAVAIARTIPAYESREVREVEALYVTAIASARRSVYLESQYFASRVVAEAIARRLGEADGPEFVIVNPASAEGWLEEEAMGSARARLLGILGRSDRFGRLRVYTPVTEGEHPIYVHAKVMIVDDRLLRVGSSNLNNRSMGYDTECDLALEASDDDTRLSHAIRSFRARLLAEHLGASIEEVARTLAEGQSLIATIERLSRPGRSLRPFEPPRINDVEKALADHELLDPERPRSLWRTLSRRTLPVLRR